MQRRLWLKLEGEQGSGFKGVDDLCFYTYGEFSPLSPFRTLLKKLLKAHIPASRPKPLPGGPDPSLDTQIATLRLGSVPPGKDLSLGGLDLGLEAGIWPLRLGFRP